MAKIHDLIPRLVQHQENQAEYYQRQLEAAQRELGRLMMIDSGQLMLWDVPLYAKGSNESYVLRAVTMGEDGDRENLSGVPQVAETD